MTTINEIVQELVDWIREQLLVPRPREVVSGSALPPSAFPHVQVEAIEEQQAPRAGSFRASLRLTVMQAQGRGEEAQATARDLAHQLRRALQQSHCLGGRVKSLRVPGLRHSAELRTTGDPGLLAKSELTVIVGYEAAQV